MDLLQSKVSLSLPQFCVSVWVACVWICVFYGNSEFPYNLLKTEHNCEVCDSIAFTVVNEEASLTFFFSNETQNFIYVKHEDWHLIFNIFFLIKSFDTYLPCCFISPYIHQEKLKIQISTFL